MTFDPNSDISGGRVSRRGRSTGIGLGLGGGGLALIVVLIAALTGVDPSALLGATGGDPAGDPAGDPSETALSCTAQQANDDIDCRVQASAASLKDYWAGELTGATDPVIIIFDGATSTGCGNATSAVGPFYCPADQQIYLDTSFWDVLRDQFGATAGPLAQVYVVGHEWGHHIQEITGQTKGLDLRATGRASDSVRLELQADCYAGAWIGAASRGQDRILEPPTKAEIADALNAAAAVGDDSIQKRTQGQSHPETWTHGSSAARQQWFETGFAQGPRACDTFSVSARKLGT